jgi:hypothetical protein
MIIFEDNYEPSEFKLINRNKQEFIIKTKLITAGDVKKIEQIGKSKKDYKTESDKIYAMLEIMFGENEKFFNQFSFNLLTKIVQAVTESLKKNLSSQTG